MRLQIFTYFILILSVWACKSKDSRIKIDDYSVGQRIDTNWVVLSSDPESKYKTLEYKNDSNITCVTIADTIITISKIFESKKQAIDTKNQIAKDFNAYFDSTFNPNVSGLFETINLNWHDLKTNDQILISASRSKFSKPDFTWSIEITNDILNKQLTQKHDLLYPLTKFAPFGSDFFKYTWYSEYDTINNFELLQKGKLIDNISFDFPKLISALNNRAAKCKIELLNSKNDTLKIKIINDEFLTEQMGSNGAFAFLGETVYTLTEHDSINFVDIQMDYGSHASPGIYRRSDYTDLRKIPKQKVIGAWGDDERYDANAVFEIYDDSIYYPAQSDWYKYRLNNDTLTAIGKYGFNWLLIENISKDSLTINYLDVDLSVTLKRRKINYAR